MEHFIAIDFETANSNASSICSIGAVMVADGVVADRFYSLVHPEPNFYNYFCQEVHGLGYADTDNAPLFPDVWEQFEQVLSDIYGDGLPPFVAHNARFDEGCLRAVFALYGMDYGYERFVDTLTASRRRFGRRLQNHRLPTVAAACGYDLSHHHHALTDAEACAAIALRLC